MKNIKKFVQQLWADESAQGVSEYILLLVVVIAVAVLFKDKITEFVRGKLDSVGSSIGDFGN